MFVSLRLAAPADLAERAERLLVADPRVCNVAVIRGGAVDPPGDAILADVAREAAADVIAALEGLGLARDGAMSLGELSASPYDAARRAARAAPGNPDDGVIWRVVEEQAWSASSPSVTYYVFLCLAVALAAIAVVTDSAILVIGAMVVGPEFSLVAAVCVGAVLGRWQIVRRSSVLLVWSFLVAIAVVAALSLLARGAGWVTTDMVTRARPQTGFIWHPDHWSFVVALLAGVAGVLSLTTGKSSPLVGVFISVTTVPAAGNLALALALWAPQEVQGAVVQLVANITGMTVAGLATLLVLRLAWARAGRRARVSPPPASRPARP